MNYTLAKELKDAGFPQGLVEGHYLEEDGKLGYGPSKKTAYEPNLEELIKACPQFSNLNKHIYEPGRIEWEANSIKTSQGYFHGEGSQPDEAVSRLYLALNQKS